MSNLTANAPAHVSADAETQTVLAQLANVAGSFASDAVARGQRTELERADFDALAAAGFLRCGVPAAEGGLWRGLSQSIRDYAWLIRTISRGDPTVALVASMHPLVLANWFAADVEAVGGGAAFVDQQQQIFAGVRGGDWWGTINSEPGSHGDIGATKAVAVKQADLDYQLTGDKHFGSGSGMAHYMITVAMADDAPDAGPQIFYMKYADEPWDGSTGVRLVAAWDGMGMSASQSHAFRFENFPARRIALDEAMGATRQVVGQLGPCFFVSVIMGIVDSLMDWAGPRVGPEARPLSRTLWVEAENTAWLLEQAFEGMLRSVETTPGRPGLVAGARAKYVCAQLAEALLSDVSRALGGSVLARRHPVSQWLQDVRALGFLRPPLGARRGPAMGDVAAGAARITAAGAARITAAGAARVTAAEAARITAAGAARTAARTNVSRAATTRATSCLMDR